MKEIKLESKKYPGMVTLVDDDMYDYLNQFKWLAWKHENTFYARRHSEMDEKCKRKTIFMHRVILGLTDPKIYCDHCDRNGLNNLENNLRIATKSQNGANRQSKKNSSSKYLGVHLEKRVRKKVWRAMIKKNGHQKHLGLFENEIDAALAYNKKAIELHGEFANLNKITA